MTASQQPSPVKNRDCETDTEHRTPTTRESDSSDQGQQQTRTSQSKHPNRTQPSEQAGSKSENICPECTGHLAHDSSRGETICQGCGLVVSESEIDHGPEWRSWNDEDGFSDGVRASGSLSETYHDKGLATQIGLDRTDANGNPITKKKRAQLKRFRTWNDRCRVGEPGDRAKRKGLTEVKRMASALAVPNPAVETASQLLKQAQSKGLFPGRSIEGMASGALYLACRVHERPTTITEVASVSRIEETIVGRDSRYVARELGVNIQPRTPLEFMPRYASELDLSQTAEALATAILKITKETTFWSGKSPNGLAAAAIYIAARYSPQDRATQEKIADVADTCVVTIRNRYREIFEYVDGVAHAYEAAGLNPPDNIDENVNVRRTQIERHS